MERGFPAEEYERRWDRAAELMTAAGLDALLVTSEPNFRYYSGFSSQTWISTTRPRYLAVRRDGAPIAIVPSSNEVGMRDGTPVSDVRTWQAPNPADEGLSILTAALRECAGRFGAIGAELGAESRIGMPAGDFLALIAALRPIEVRDAVPIITAQRLVKSAGEVDRIRRMARIASEAFADLPRFAAGRSTVREVCRILQSELLLRGADKTPYVVGEAGQDGYETIMMGPGDHPLAPGDLVFIDTGSQYDGYFCDFDRHFAVGPPSEAVECAYRSVSGALAAGLAAVQPGRTMADLWRAMAGALDVGSDSGSPVGRMGHGLGLSLTEPPSVQPQDATILVPGMVITLEPSLAYSVPGRSGQRRKLMVHEENVAVTEDGCELLSERAPDDIPRLEIRL